MTASAAVTRRHPDDLIVGFVSISDRASTGVYQDEGFPRCATGSAPRYRRHGRAWSA
ncbi:hypothetical protein ACEQUB_00868 [Ralstonia syzygii]